MRGTGKQSDPLIPEKNNWSEFLTAIYNSGYYVSLESGSVYDLDTIYPNGITSTIEIRCAELQGNGAKILNLYCPTGNAFHGGWGPNTKHIKGMKFLNCYIESAYFMRGRDNIYWSDSQTIIFEDCTFAGMLFNSMITHRLTFTSWQFYRCAFDLILHNSSIHDPDIGYPCTDCHVNVIGTTSCHTFFSNFSRCTVTTILETSDTGEHTWGTFRFTNKAYSVNIDNTKLTKFDGYFKAENKDFMGATSTSKNLFNITKTPLGNKDDETGTGTGVVNVPNAILCTDEQINDVNYLFSQGFPVVYQG